MLVWVQTETRTRRNPESPDNQREDTGSQTEGRLAALTVQTLFHKQQEDVCSDDSWEVEFHLLHLLACLAC